MSDWEVGSEFDWSDRFLATESQPRSLPRDCDLFSTGTACLLAFRHILGTSTRRVPRIHLPSFYCMDVARVLQQHFDVCWYRDLPSEPAPDFQTLVATPGDVVLLLNAFGLRTQSSWHEFQTTHEHVTFIEDHSHDPFSDWAQDSTSHYAFASLRKTLPIPDGGMLWSPQGLAVPSAWGTESLGAAKRLTAMLLKRAYLAGASIDKDNYRQLEISSHVDLADQHNVRISAFTRRVLPYLDIDRQRQRRRSNVERFVRQALATPHPHWQPLFTSWPAGCVPFNAIVTCPDRDTRDGLRSYLTQQNIFTAIHWVQPNEGVSSEDARTLQLVDRLLTIPLDARYDAQDVDRVFAVMSDFALLSDAA